MENEPSPNWTLLEQNSFPPIKPSHWRNTKNNLDFRLRLQLDGSHYNRKIFKLSGESASPVRHSMGAAEGEIDVDQEDRSGRRVLFRYIFHPPTSLRPGDWQFFRHRFRQDRFRNSWSDCQGHISRHGGLSR